MSHATLSLSYKALEIFAIFQVLVDSKKLLSTPSSYSSSFFYEADFLILQHSDYIFPLQRASPDSLS